MRTVGRAWIVAEVGLPSMSLKRAGQRANIAARPSVFSSVSPSPNKGDRGIRSGRAPGRWRSSIRSPTCAYAKPTHGQVIASSASSEPQLLASLGPSRHTRRQTSLTPAIVKLRCSRTTSRAGAAKRGGAISSSAAIQRRDSIIQA